MTLLNIRAMLRRACKVALVYEEHDLGLVKVGFYDPSKLPDKLLQREVIGVYETVDKDSLVVALARPQE